ncbi:hypothetical protein MSG28_004592 [Choristoneura fumiferana]|uniref:Uncharacterized protein n=1 Tax=Choristoneura fumiferana TaxID=7141 RepID=A0ACC0K6N9_CHOFU|nr:hypothetical protein MSG28_004592 [Choristoneura fumiferana]
MLRKDKLEPHLCHASAYYRGQGPWAAWHGHPRPAQTGPGHCRNADEAPRHCCVPTSQHVVSEEPTQPVRQPRSTASYDFPLDTTCVKHFSSTDRHVTECTLETNKIVGSASMEAYSKHSDLESSSSIRNFMTDIMPETDLLETEARIIKEVIEEDADVLDESLDSHWLQDDVSIDTNFKLDFSFENGTREPKSNLKGSVLRGRDTGAHCDGGRAAKALQRLIITLAVMAYSLYQLGMEINSPEKFDTTSRFKNWEKLEELFGEKTETLASVVTMVYYLSYAIVAFLMFLFSALFTCGAYSVNNCLVSSFFLYSFFHMFLTIFLIVWEATSGGWIQLGLIVASDVGNQPLSKMVVIFAFLSCLVFVSAEHSGAYSSPQYAKKLYPRQGFDTNALLPHDKPPVPFEKSIDRFDSVSNDTTQYARASILNSAGSFLSGAGGQMVTNLAKDVIARSTGSSQVLSLNLTNLVILIVLKALILAAGFFGAGAWKGGHHYGRSLDDNMNVSYVTEDEILINSLELQSYEDISKGIKQAAAWGEEGMSCDARYQCGD